MMHWTFHNLHPAVFWVPTLLRYLCCPFLLYIIPPIVIIVIPHSNNFVPLKITFYWVIYWSGLHDVLFWVTFSIALVAFRHKVASLLPNFPQDTSLLQKNLWGYLIEHKILNGSKSMVGKAWGNELVGEQLVLEGRWQTVMALIAGWRVKGWMDRKGSS